MSGYQVIYAGSYLPAGPDPEAITEDVLAEHPWIREELGPAPGKDAPPEAPAIASDRARSPSANARRGVW